MEYLGPGKEKDSDKDRRVTQLRKGILELAVLRALSEERHYGYSLIKALSSRAALELKEGTLYPILARLDRDGLVGTEWVESLQGPPRKYYSLTPAGRQLFAELQEEFDFLASLILGRWKPATPNQESDHEPLSILRFRDR
jgi:PadR family transcriptional regulator PadR